MFYINSIVLEGRVSSGVLKVPGPSGQRIEFDLTVPDHQPFDITVACDSIESRTVAQDLRSADTVRVIGKLIPAAQLPLGVQVLCDVLSIEPATKSWAGLRT